MKIQVLCRFLESTWLNTSQHPLKFTAQLWTITIKVKVAFYLKYASVCTSYISHCCTQNVCYCSIWADTGTCYDNEAQLTWFDLMHKTPKLDAPFGWETFRLMVPEYDRNQAAGWIDGCRTRFTVTGLKWEWLMEVGTRDKGTPRSGPKGEIEQRNYKTRPQNGSTHWACGCLWAPVRSYVCGQWCFDG